MTKPAITAAVLVLLSVPAFAQDAKTNSPARIPAGEAREHLNSDAVVTGRIVEVNKAERLVRLNFDHPFPKQTLTAVIFANRTNQFSGLDQLKGKTVEVTGKITEFRNRPEIILTSTNQLKIVEKTAEPPGKAE
jgi:DNA/RNA endonuclease YhcR with UshA esterase domain